MLRRPAVALLLVAGCGADASPLSVDVLVAPKSCAEKPVRLSESDLPDGVVRLTVGRQSGSGAEELVCNALTPHKAGSAGGLGVAIPLDAGEGLNLLVEVFDRRDPPRLLAQGKIVGANSRARPESARVVLARRSQESARRLSCAGGAMVQGRAFHSATVLPSGEVLLLGGVTVGAAGSLAFADVVEVYDPRSGAFREVGHLPGRAFHTATLLVAPSWEGPFDVLVVGGLGPGASSEAALALGGDADPLPLVPAPGVQAAPSLVLRYYPWADEVELLGAPPRLTPRLFHATALLPDGRIALCGGASGHGPGELEPLRDFEVVQRGSTLRAGPVPLLQWRVGAMAAPIAANRVLLFGGNLDSLPEAFELLDLESGKERSVAVASAGAALAPLAFGTLTPAGRASDPHLLLAGGLLVEDHRAARVSKENKLYRIVETDPERVSVDVVPDSGGFKPVAYNASSAVPASGEVVLSGGWPVSCDGSAKLCGSAELHRYRDGKLSLDATMSSPRMGHTMVVLPGDIALVSGGLHQQGGQIVALSSAELWPLSDGGYLLDPWAREPAALDAEHVCGTP